MNYPPLITDFRKAEGWRMIKNRIRELRARHQMKQEELARRVGVRRETIGNLEKGRYNPSLVLAWKIAAVFGVHRGGFYGHRRRGKKRADGLTHKQK